MLSLCLIVNAFSWNSALFLKINPLIKPAKRFAHKILDSVYIGGGTDREILCACKTLCERKNEFKIVFRQVQGEGRYRIS